MCPMIKEGDPPVSFDLLEEARSNLSREYGFALGEEDGRTVLFVRAPESKPDPFHSLEVVSFAIAEGDLAGVKDVFLIGDARVVRVEPDTLRELVQERREEDPEVAKHLRNRLDRDHDYTVFRHKGARDHLRLGARIPRERVDDLAEEDRQALAENLAPIVGSLKGRQIRAFYLIADEHARRLGEDELVELVGPPLREAVEERAEPEGPEDEPEIETEPPGGADQLGSSDRGPAADGSVQADPDEPRGAEIIDAESSPPSSGASRDEPGQQPPGAGLEADDGGGSTPSQQPPGAGLESGDGGGSSPSQQPPGAHLEPDDASSPSSGGSSGGLGGGGSPGGPPSLDEIDESEIEEDGGAMFLDSDGPSEDAKPDGGSPEPAGGAPEAPTGKSPDGASGSPDEVPGGPDASAPAEPSPEADPGGSRGSQGSSTPTGSSPADGSPSTGSASPAGSGGASSSGSSDTGFSPDDDGIAGLAGRGSRFDRPEPDQGDDGEADPGADAGEAGDGGDDMIVADVEQAPEAEVPTPDEAGDGAAEPAGQPAGSPADAAPGADASPPPAQDAPATGSTGGGAEAAGGQPAQPETPPAAHAAKRLREAGYEVVEGVEAGGQPFDFAADRPEGKRLLGLAVESLDPQGVAALAEAGRESGADAVLAIPLEVAPGTREAAWGTVVDLLPPDAAASLEL